MPRNTHVTKEPVILEGYQAVLKPSKFGYCLSCLLDEEMVETLETERAELLKWGLSKVKNPKRAVCKPEPWVDASPGKYQVKYTWNAETKPPIVDTEGTEISDENTPLYSGSKVKLAFYQKPYVLKDGETYGTSLKLQAVQVVAVASGAGVDTGDLDAEGAAELFGKSKGFKQATPNVTPAPTATEDGEDIEF